MPKNDSISLEKGQKTIRSVAAQLGQTPGVYRMLSEKGDVLYVGKARALKRRVLSYTQIAKLPVRLQRMVAETHSMEIINTHSEVEALLLESNLIKKLKPRYNIVLRDDKSFPYICITGNHDYPRLVKHRGTKTIKGEYYGPFASAGAVNRTITALQRAFMLRNCTDNMFDSRKRPCLQYHIKRCTAPCVNFVTREEYMLQVKEAEDFLEGDSKNIQNRFRKRMEEASEKLDFENAAKYRDRLRALSAIQSKQTINVGEIRDADVHAIAMEKGRSAIQTFFFRGGQNFGNKSYFPKHDPDEDPANILSAFLVQFYENKPIPPLLLVNKPLPEHELLAEALSAQRTAKVEISCPVRGTRKKLIGFVEVNAVQALKRKVSEASNDEECLEALVELFDLDDIPERIEVYDNSHISGSNMVGAMIVAGPEGFIKNAYRKFNIKQAGEADDFGMMREVMERRFSRLKKEIEEDPDSATQNKPDLVLIDGGKGQLSSVLSVLEDLDLKDDLNIVAISKGPDRNAGREQFHREGQDSFQLEVNDPVLFYLQRLRDEAHRFAIGAHRTRRKKDISVSRLDDVPGIGAKRKKELLHHFGSAKAVERAAIDDLISVEGISRQLAEKIYNYLNSAG
ncbi:MAG: excinuclease ABC subunit C [Alphaproteobacteria bacterium]|nr:excinuclease ABC subunit C [Alphaproteobacteria bacterium]